MDFCKRLVRHHQLETWIRLLSPSTNDQNLHLNNCNLKVQVMLLNCLPMPISSFARRNFSMMVSLSSENSEYAWRRTDDFICRNLSSKRTFTMRCISSILQTHNWISSLVVAEKINSYQILSWKKCLKKLLHKSLWSFGLKIVNCEIKTIWLRNNCIK